MSSPGSPDADRRFLKIEPFRGGSQLMIGGGVAGLVLLALTLVGRRLTSPKDDVLLVPGRVRLLVRDRVRVAAPADDLPRHARALDGDPAASRRGDGGVDGGLPAAGHPDPARDEAALLLGRPGRGRVRRGGAGQDRAQGVLAERELLHRAQRRSTSCSRPSSGWRLYGWSRRQDKEGGTALLVRQRRLVGAACCRSSPSRSPSRRSTG